MDRRLRHHRRDDAHLHAQVSGCVCGSGRPYKACCEPFHRGLREAPDAESLMRSRYAAFALKDADYLVRTLHPDHADRALPEAEIRRSIRVTTTAFKYMGLAILDRAPPGDDGIAVVLFFAKIFEKGQERSFVERSEFMHDGEGWRYLRGEMWPVQKLAGDPAALTLATFPRR
jgi:SEC-C motif domain protein